MISTYIALHTLLCVALLLTVLVRLFRTDDQTFEAVRLAFWLLAVAAIIGLLAPWAHKMFPWFGRFKPHASTLLMEAGIVAVQLVTAKHWRTCVPSQFQNSFAQSQYDTDHARLANEQAEARWGGYKKGTPT